MNEQIDVLKMDNVDLKNDNKIKDEFIRDAKPLKDKILNNTVTYNFQFNGQKPDEIQQIVGAIEERSRLQGNQMQLQMEGDDLPKLVEDENRQIRIYADEEEKVCMEEMHPLAMKQME